MLSVVAFLSNPLGLVSPITITDMMLFQLENWLERSIVRRTHKKMGGLAPHFEFTYFSSFQ